jgi:amidase
MWTILHVPCLNIPGFEGENKLPIGLTLVGPRYTDEHVLWVGKSIGEVFAREGGWKSKLI